MCARAHPKPFFSPVLCTDVGVCGIRSEEAREHLSIWLPHWKGSRGSLSLSRGALGYVHSRLFRTYHPIDGPYPGTQWLLGCLLNLIFFFPWLNYFALIKIKPKKKTSCVIREHFNPNRCKRWPAIIEHLLVPECVTGHLSAMLVFHSARQKDQVPAKRSHFLVLFPLPTCLICYCLPYFRVHNLEM